MRQNIKKNVDMHPTHFRSGIALLLTFAHALGQVSHFSWQASHTFWVGYRTSLDIRTRFGSGIALLLTCIPHILGRVSHFFWHSHTLWVRYRTPLDMHPTHFGSGIAFLLTCLPHILGQVSRFSWHASHTFWVGYRTSLDMHPTRFGSGIALILRWRHTKEYTRESSRIVLHRVCIYMFRMLGNIGNVPFRNSVLICVISLHQHS